MTPYNNSNRIPVQEQYKNVSYPVWIYPVVYPQANDKTMPRRFQTSGDNDHILPDLHHHPKFPTMYCFFHPVNSYIQESLFDSLAYMPDRPFHYLSKPSIKAECQKCLYQMIIKLIQMAQHCRKHLFIFIVRNKSKTQRKNIGSLPSFPIMIGKRIIKG